MNKILKKIVSSIGGLILLFTGFSTAFAGMPAPLDDPGKVKIALVRFLSTGDFFQAYLGGVESQAQAIGVDLSNESTLGVHHFKTVLNTTGETCLSGFEIVDFGLPGVQTVFGVQHVVKFEATLGWKTI